MTFIRTRPVVPTEVGGTFAALLVAVLAFSLLQTMVVPALPDLQREFETTPTVISWVLSSFLLTSSVGTVIVGRLGDMFGKKRMLLASLALLALGTLLAAISTTVGMLIGARAVQGIGAATFPLAFGIVRDTFPRERVPVAIGAISAMFGIGFGVGLVLPGPIVDALGWEWIFWVSLAVIVVALLAVSLLVAESTVRSPGRIDWSGAVLLATALVVLLLAISESRVWDGWMVAVLAVGAVLALASFAALERRTRSPLVNIGLLRTRAVATANVSALIIGFGMYGAFTLVPQLVQTPASTGYGVGATVTESGLYLLPMAITMLFAGPFAGRIGARGGFKATLALACGIGAIGFAFFAVGGATAWTIATGAGVLGIGIGFAFSSMANLVVASVDPGQTGEATGVNTIVRTLGGSIGAQVASALVAANLIGGTSIPAERGYMIAFVVSAVAMVVAGLVALAGPGGAEGAGALSRRRAAGTR